MSKIIKSEEAFRLVQRQNAIAREFGSTNSAAALAEQNGGVRESILAAAEILRQAKRDAALLVSRAQAHAVERLQAMEAERESLLSSVETARQEAWKQGFDQGREAGFEQGRAEGVASVEAMVAQLDHVIRGAGEEREKILDQCKDDLVKLALAVAERLLCEEIAEGPNRVEALLKRLLPQLEGASAATIRLAPESLERLGDDKELFVDLVQTGAQVKLEADESLSRADVVIEFDWGIIDARMRSRWRRVVEGLDLMGGNPDEGLGG